MPTAWAHIKIRYKKHGIVESRHVMYGEHAVDLPGKNPGENLCRDTVITLDVKLKASSTPTKREKSEGLHQICNSCFQHLEI